MNVQRMIVDLQKQKEATEQAIVALQVLAANGGKRRGRPPLWMSELSNRPKLGRPKKAKKQ